MSPNAIHRIRVKNYGCLNDVTIELTPLHALIGPNDSGKSTILRAVRTIVQLASSRFDKAIKKPFDPMVGSEPRHFEIAALLNSGKPEIEYRIKNGHFKNGHGDLVESWFVGDEPHQKSQRPWDSDTMIPGPVVLSNETPLKGARLVRFDPDPLRKPSRLLQSSELLDLFDERGFGLAGILDALRDRNDEAFREIVEEVRKLFPVIQRIGFEVNASSEKELAIDLTTGQGIRATFLSEGLLYFLAFAALPYLQPVSVLLVEEPENGLHPARIADVMRVLRKISEKTQVLIATHSPLVINELKPDEVTVVTRKEKEGTIVTPLGKTPRFDERSKVYALGELWLSYANGIDESPLLDPEQK